MKAEDTVMDSYAIEDFFVKPVNYEDPTIEEELSLAKDVAQAQAEISFKGGIKEVVEWIRSKVYKETHLKNFPTIKAYYISDEMLEAKLKEWGTE
ncbi:MAG: hypothetical protein MUP81_02865 [Dehalococcoidia bacterium]|nr:hypothetical protein [Dehalococcoidia bacterium]